MDEKVLEKSSHLPLLSTDIRSQPFREILTIVDKSVVITRVALLCLFARECHACDTVNK